MCIIQYIYVIQEWTVVIFNSGDETGERLGVITQSLFVKKVDLSQYAFKFLFCRYISILQVCAYCSMYTIHLFIHFDSFKL